jgi:hypothetical protein
MQSKPIILASAGIVFLFVSAEPACANWSIRTLTNHTGQIISVDYPVPPGARRTYGDLGVGGDAVVAIPGFGVVTFEDTGHKPYCGPYWSVAITYNGSQWGMFYDGGGTVDMIVNADGTLGFTPGPGTQVVSGTGPPVC